MANLNASYRYSQWDGTQNPFDLDEASLMDEMADELIAHGNVHRALRDLMQRGARDPNGQRTPGLRRASRAPRRVPPWRSEGQGPDPPARYHRRWLS